MKKFIFAILFLFPLTICAQSNTPTTPEEQLAKAQKQLEEAQKAVEKAKAEAEKAKQEKAKAEAKAKEKAAAKAKSEADKAAEKALREKQAAIQEQIKKAQAEAERLKAEAKKLNAETEKIASESSGSPATSGWTVPNTANRSRVAKTNSAQVANTEVNEAKYLSGAIPEVDGKVVFTLDLDVPGKNAQEIYDMAYAYLDDLSQGPEQFDESAVVLLNQNDHIIAARYKEWLTFSNNFISLDRTVFSYTVIAQCSDQHLHLTMERMNYNYEEGRSTGFKTSAEEWITDKYGLNKKQDKLSKLSGKFRRKTIDRKDELFNGIENALLH
ncbi:MAG: DUF4468 domain-containing protein [Prevotella sp.]|nr:DUF4468 domain-containing protein [Prevotella sp.]